MAKTNKQKGNANNSSYLARRRSVLTTTRKRFQQLEKVRTKLERLSKQIMKSISEINNNHVSVGRNLTVLKRKIKQYDNAVIKIEKLATSIYKLAMQIQ